MWVLETDGNVLQGKKLWLRPGKRFIFGRTKSEDNPFVIADKTISRQHLVVEVGTIGLADCHKAQSRSKLTLTDQDTKIGTLVNGEQIRGKSHVVTSDENVVKLGRADPYTALYQQLGPLDIKVLADFQRGVTTHLVTKKRNTSKGLQSLICGSYIVFHDSYVNALVAACTPPTDGSKTVSPLEEDWDGSFPEPLEYLPPRGEEPTQRDASAYAPNLGRQNMFEGYTFVFCERRQFENLLPPITEGRGTALLQEAIPNETSVENFVRYVKGVAGEKGLGSFEDGSGGKGVVVVRFNPTQGEGTEWFTEFNQQVSLCLDHRLIEQNEFLDAILRNDASVLRKPLEFVQSGVVAPPPSVATGMSSQTLRSSPPQPAPTPASMAPPGTTWRGRSRRTATTRFRGFDEDFSAPLASVPESMSVDPTPTAHVESQDLFVSQDPPRFDQDREGPVASDTQRGTTKRSTPPVDYNDTQAILDEVAPTVQNFKKRKIAEAARRRRGESTSPPPLATKFKLAAKTRTKPAKKEIDVEEVLAQKQAEEADKTAQAEERIRIEHEAQKEALGDMDIDAIRNLAIVEEMPITRRAPRPGAAVQADESDRWDERWNGRKNFKKFKRRGADQNGPRVSRVIVPLEEVKKKDFGIGNKFWLGDEAETTSQKKKKGKGRHTQDTQTQSQARPVSQAKFRARGAAVRAAQILSSDAEDEYALPDDEEDRRVAESIDVEVVEPPPKSASRSQRASKLAYKTNESQNLLTHKGNKRTAAATLIEPAPAKKARSAPVEEASDDDSDDGLKFRFGRR